MVAVFLDSGYNLASRPAI